MFAFVELLQKTPVAELGPLIDELDYCPFSQERSEFLKLAFAKWTVGNPSAALAQALLMSKRGGVIEPLPWVFDAWASMDAKAALEAAQRIENLAYRKREINDILDTLVESNPQAALAAMNNLPKGMADYVALFEHWAHQDPQAAWASLGQIADFTQRQKAQATVIGLMAASDPSAAFNILQHISAGQQAAQLFKQVFLQWGRQDPKAAFAALAALPVGSARQSAIQSLFTGWIEMDPSAALQAAQSYSPGRDRDAAIKQCLEGLAMQSPLDAADFVAALPAGLAKNNYVGILVRDWVQIDPSAAFTWLQRNAAGKTYDDAVGVALDALGAEDPQKAIDCIAQLPAGSKQDVYLQTVLGDWAKNDPTAAITWVNNNLTGGRHDSVFASVVRQLIQTDPVSVSNYVLSLPGGPERDNDIVKLAGTLSGESASTAADWLQSLPSDTSPKIFNQAMQNVFLSWMKSDPAGAAAYLGSQSPDSILGAALTANSYAGSTPLSQSGSSAVGTNGQIRVTPLAVMIADAWAASDGQSALTWAEALPEGDARSQAIFTAVRGLAATDPGAAWNYAKDTNNANMLNGVISTWSQADPAQAAAALATLSPESYGQGPIASIATNWSQQDPKAALQWINTLPADSLRDGALSIYLGEQVLNNPSAAYALALTINADAVRLQQVRNVAMQWSKVDMPAAIAAVQNAPLTDQQKASIVDAMQRQRGPEPPSSGLPLGR